MAGFPPKSPRDHQKPPMSNGGGAAAMPTWVDEFLDFSSARRSLHRRSISDSIAFFEVAPVPPPPVREENFDRLDDEQLMNMFSDDIPGISSSTTPSDHSEKASSGGGGGGNDEKPEVQSVCKQEENGGTPAGMGGDSNIDPKRVRRILANRQSAQRSRVRKLQYISELERSVSSLQAEVSILSPRVAFLDHQRLVLNVDNSALKQRIAVLAQDKMFKDAHQEALKKEIERLRMVYHQQSIKKMNPTTDAHQPQDVELVN